MMAIRLAILGLDLVQREWVAAVEGLRREGVVEVVGVGDRTVALAKGVADGFGNGVAAFDDLRQMMKEAGPEVILMDRPEHVGVEFLRGCAEAGVGVLSLGPPVGNVAEAQGLAEVLGAKTNLMYVWPRMGDSYAYRHCAQADEFVRPIRFAGATWLGMNHALAKGKGGGEGLVVRSLSVLAWDALATLIELLGVPTSVYASVRGSVAAGATFLDMTGAAGLTLRFAEDAVASVMVSDQVAGAGRRELMLLGQAGAVKLERDAYEFRDGEGKLIDSGRREERSGGGAEEVLREFLREFREPASGARGWEHRLVEVAATMEAMVVSHRTGQAESPERFLMLRR